RVVAGPCHSVDPCGYAVSGWDHHTRTPLHPPTSHWPKRLSPTAMTVPSERRARVWAQPAAIATMSRHSATSHWPKPFHPVATAVPSARRPTAWWLPAAIAVISRQAPTSHWPSLFEPTAATVPSARSPTVWR